MKGEWVLILIGNNLSAELGLKMKEKWQDLEISVLSVYYMMFDHHPFNRLTILTGVINQLDDTDTEEIWLNSTV